MSNRYAITLKSDRTAPALLEGGSEVLVRSWLNAQVDLGDYEVYTPGEQYVPAVEFMGRGMVSKYYVMDPKTEDLVPNGNHLANGMVVLIGTSNARVGITDETEEWELDRAFERNQWCTVSNLQYDNDRDQVSFVGTYEDGSKRKRTYGVAYEWLVKVDSITPATAQETMQYFSVLKLVKSAIDSAEPGEYLPGAKNSKILAEETTKKILELL